MTIIFCKKYYAEDFEEILECPVCLEIPNGEVSMCITGHHLCCKCKDLLLAIGSNCPICEATFSTSRNFTVEKLCQKFEDIRSSILDPRHSSNRKVIKNKTSVYVQTDEILSNKNILTENNNMDSKEKDSLIINTNNNMTTLS
ncbi:uncharacterized protein LOC131665969 [Phymastichus coffea]|uniref:uncharacterized protein LOC131665969 n=1 Tax=Phymastichus coffea TaxID=108790 RepID=UPI00273CE128|nr:uncharacterized protein LOC131665969 [Phymastichus coffea]